MEDRCFWREDADGQWFTSCDQAHSFFDGGPGLNQYRFCPYCGKPLHEIEYSETVEQQQEN